MQPRLFSKKQKMAVELVTGQTGEADHVVPYSKGGKTDVENLQLISGRINRMKGAFKFEPRDWQIDFLANWENREAGRPFMLIAIPGSGKTMAALEASRRWSQAGTDRRIIVVVPTDNLRKQWHEEALKFGLQLQTKEFGTNFKDGFKGGVATYHLIASQPLVFRKLCSVAPTMVIFDEIHHCGEDSQFGYGIREAFENASERLLMSGTPWKTNGKPIPFVHYDGDGYAIGDQRYDYPHALNDEVVRYLVFNHAKGSVTNVLTGEIREVSGEIQESDAAKALSILLDADGDYASQQILDSHNKLLEVRKTVPDAAALAICIDQYHAIKIASVIKKVTGCDPSIIVSDEQIENDKIQNFRDSKKEWLVSVRKVSEGTDIKRLQVLCYLTNITSELFFRQVIGRVSRVRELEDYEGYIFLPADPRLIAAARNIENAQVLALQDDIEKIKREREKTEKTQPEGVFTTSHDGTDLILVGNQEVSKDEHRLIEQIASQAKVSQVQARKVLDAALQLGHAINGIKKQPDSFEPLTSLEDEIQKLRVKCNARMYRLSKKLGVKIEELHKRFKPQAEMSKIELVTKLKWIESELVK